jgi:hypothetical protein
MSGTPGAPRTRLPRRTGQASVLQSLRSSMNRDDEMLVDVAIAKWPEEQARVLQLAQGHVPRLLLVRPDASPPVATDVLEDWVRLPCGERDLRARVVGLQRKAIEFAPPPVVGPDGRFGYIGAVTYLPTIRKRLAVILVDRFEAVVSEATLIEHGWEGVPRVQLELTVSGGPTSPSGQLAGSAARPRPRARLDPASASTASVRAIRPRLTIRRGLEGPVVRPVAEPGSPSSCMGNDHHESPPGWEVFGQRAGAVTSRRRRRAQVTTRPSSPVQFTSRGSHRDRPVRHSRVVRSDAGRRPAGIVRGRTGSSRSPGSRRAARLMVC